MKKPRHLHFTPLDGWGDAPAELSIGYYFGGGKGGDAPDPPDYEAAARAQGQADKETAIINAAYGRPTQIGPTGKQTWAFQGADINNPKPGDWVVTNRLSPEQQRLYNQNTQISANLNQTAIDSLGRVSRAMRQPFDTSTSDPYMQALQVVQSRGGQVPTSMDQFEGMQNEAEQAAYSRATQFMDERFNRQNAQLDTQLRNQGLQPGTEAYDTAMREARRTQNEAYDTAQNQSILTGNQLAHQKYSDLVAALAQQQGLDQIANAANLSTGQAATQMQAYLRSLPLNEANALRTGNQVNMPTFQAYQNGAVQSAPIYQAVNDKYSNQVANWNAQQASQGNFMSGLMSMGGQLGSAWMLK